MDPSLASGDNIELTSSLSSIAKGKEMDAKNNTDCTEPIVPIYDEIEKTANEKEITPESIEDHEKQLLERISQCKSVIESLKIELNEEKAKIEMEEKAKLEMAANPQQNMSNVVSASSTNYDYNKCMAYADNTGLTTNTYRASVDSKFGADENMMEYEQQLKKYQNTLNMAQIEKRNAIRKQMLAKAYKLKLLEVENQCNIELLRVKQSLQCLEPLQRIISNWKNSKDEAAYSLENFDLMFSSYPELQATSGSDNNFNTFNNTEIKPQAESNSDT